jgi:hypothetical protein
MFMKRMIITLLLCLVLLSPFVGKGQDTTGLAKVYFIRGTSEVPGQYGPSKAIRAYKVYIDTALVCILNYKTYSVHNLSVGKHKVRVHMRGPYQKNYSDEKTILVQAGKSYYVAFDFRGFMAPNPIVMHPLKEDLAQMILPDLKQDNSCTGRD